LNTDLRERLGFKGYVMSDWGATHSLAVHKGMDQEMGFDSHNLYYNKYSLKEYPAEVDQSNIRMFTQFFKFGSFDQIPDANRNMSSNVTTPERKEKAKWLSTESTVLLKNDNNTLPLGDSI
jgi:beta-glucosidase|tara:strand:- start:39 stop:401 length:363 start_codon:yes stop_codon:yes gene_type:complete